MVERFQIVIDGSRGSYYILFELPTYLPLEPLVGKCVNTIVDVMIKIVECFVVLW